MRTARIFNIPKELKTSTLILIVTGKLHSKDPGTDWSVNDGLLAAREPLAGIEPATP
jgi:hypothetical protein